MQKAVNIPVVVCGRMHDPDICEDAVASGKVDGVVIGRQMLADPDFAVKMKTNRAEDIRPCLSCNFGCRGKMQDGLGQRCAVNPVLRRESEIGLLPVTDRQKKTHYGHRRRRGRHGGSPRCGSAWTPGLIV